MLGTRRVKAKYNPCLCDCVPSAGEKQKRLIAIVLCCRNKVSQVLSVLLLSKCMKATLILHTEPPPHTTVSQARTQPLVLTLSVAEEREALQHKTKAHFRPNGRYGRLKMARLWRSSHGMVGSLSPHAEPQQACGILQQNGEGCCARFQPRASNSPSCLQEHSCLEPEQPCKV